MTPAELHRLLALVEARRSRDLARLDAALAEDRRLAAEIAELAATAALDLAEGDLPLAQQGLRLRWADRRIAGARLRRAELVTELASLRVAAAQSVGKHRALEHVLERAEREAARVGAARAEREAPPPARRDHGGFGPE